MEMEDEEEEMIDDESLYDEDESDEEGEEGEEGESGDDDEDIWGGREMVESDDESGDDMEDFDDDVSSVLSIEFRVGG